MSRATPGRKVTNGQAIPTRPLLASEAFAEAVARLHYLTDNRQTLGIVVGVSGSGKTRLFSHFAQEVRRKGADAAILDLRGMDEVELYWSVANQLGCHVGHHPSKLELWRTLSDRIAENVCQRIQTVLLCEHADHARSEVRTELVRLTHASSAVDSGLTVILTSEPSGLAKIGGALLELCQLRIELETWSEAEAADYLDALKVERRCQVHTESDAIQQIHALTGGVPRKVTQLSEMALLAASASDSQWIDSETVQGVHESLFVTAER